MRRALPDAAAAAGIALLALAAWLFLPRERAGAAPTAPPLRVVLVDVSASAVWRRDGWFSWVEGALVRQAHEAEAAGEDLCTFVYGAQVRRLYGPAPANGFLDASGRPSSFLEYPHPSKSWWGERFSDLAGAVRAASTLVAQGGRARYEIVLLGDGTYTGRDPRRELAELEREGVAVGRIDLPAPDLPETTVGPLSLPGEVEEGAPIPLDCEVFYGPGNGVPEKSVTLRVQHEFPAGHTYKELEVSVPSGVALDPDGYLRWRVRSTFGPAEAGLNRVSVGGRRGRGSTAHEASGTGSAAVIRAKGTLTVGVVRSETSYAQFPLVHEPGLDAVPLRLDGLSQTLESLDAVVTVDVSLDRLPIEILDSFVRRGGGWLAAVDLQSLATFEAERNGLLPIQPPKDDREPRDVVFLVDRSGSMAGERLENVRRAVLSLIDLAPPGDAVELRWFSDRLSDGVPLIERSDSRRPRDRAEKKRVADDRFLASQAPGGPTALLRSLESLAEVRERDGRESLVILLTDGKENVDPDPSANAARIRERLGAARVHLVVMAAGENADLELLSRFVPPGEELLRVTSLLDSFSSTQIENLFRRELAKERMREGESLKILPASGLLASGAENDLGAEILRAQQADLPGEWPTIRRFVRAELSDGAEGLWRSESGEPLLALQRVGLGVVAASAFAPSVRKDEDPNALGRLFTPLVRAIARGKRGVGPFVRVDRDEIVVEGLPEDTPAALEARLFAKDAEATDPPIAVIPLSPAIEGADPRRARHGTWPASHEGDFWSLFDAPESETGRTPRVEVRESRIPSAWNPIQLAVALPQSPEFLLPRPRVPALTDLSPSARHPDASHDSPPRPHPAAPWVLLSGMLLLAGAGFAGSFGRRAG